MKTVSDLLRDVPIPKMVRVRQRYDETHIPDDQLYALMQSELARPALADQIRPGMRIAITCGSRGIHQLQIH